MLSVIMLSVTMLSVVMLNVVVPNNSPSPPSTKYLHDLTSILHLGASLYKP
jgi:hypothetical protein